VGRLFLQPDTFHHLPRLALIVIWTIVLFRRRHVLSFFLLFYLAHLFLISNLVVEIGTTLGERLIYLPSFAYCIVFGYGIYFLLEKTTAGSLRKMALLSLSGVFIVLCGMRVISRNADWKNDSTIFTHDLTLAPNSVLVNGNAGKAYIDMSNVPENKAQETDLVKKAIPPLRHALELHPTYLNGYFNLGVAYFKLGMLDSTYANWLKGHAISPNSPLMHAYAGVFINKGLESARKNDLPVAIDFLSKAVTLDQNNADAWANLGGAYFTVKNYALAKQCWEAALRLDPNHAEASRGYQAVKGMGQTPSGSLK
jgi:tetratricopeptide (TPR) repeat protein